MSASVIHIVVQIVGGAFAVASVVWAIAEHRRYGDRVPLVKPLDLRALGIGLGWMLLLVPILYVIFAFELIPKGSPVLFAAMLGWVSVASIAGLMAVLARLQGRFALGWLTFVDEQTLRLEADGLDETVVLRPGAVRAYLCESAQQSLRFDIAHGDRTLHLMVMVPITEFGLAKEGVMVEACGPTLGFANKRFCRLVRPFVTKE
jgi:hypothetical protein